MKILFYAHLFGPSTSGIPLSNLELAKGLADLGNTVEVVTCKGLSPSSREERTNLNVHLMPKWPFATLGSLNGKGLFNWLFLPWYYGTVNARIRSFRPNVLFIADETTNCFWGVWSRQISLPYVAYCSVPHIYRWGQGVQEAPRRFKKVNQRAILRSFLINSYTGARKLLVASNSTKHELIRGHKNLEKKIHLLPRSVDNRFFTTPRSNAAVADIRNKFGIQDDDYVILSVTRVSIAKGVDTVLDAINALKPDLKKRVKYIVAGTGEALRQLKAMCNDMDLNNNVYFAGKIPHNKIISYYDVCNLFVLPSRRGSSESFGRVFVEAASRSKPGIGVDAGGMKDIIDEGITGHLIPAGDEGRLRDHIAALSTNPETGRKLGANARKKALQLYTTESVAQQLHNHLAWAANGQ